MKTNILLTAIIAAVILFGCKSKKTADTHAGVNRNGVYFGITPCADCSGIETRATLNQDGTYVISRKYQGHEDVYEEKGKFTQDASGSKITLRSSGDNSKTYFNVGDGWIIMLDQKGREIKGELADRYVLTKVNPALTGRKWKLAELSGKKFETPQNAFILLDAAGNSASGNLNCNDFAGSYELKTGNRIKFYNIIVTQKMCLNMEIEDGLKKALDMADNYHVTEDRLVLNHARTAPLAVFVPEPSQP
jgi:heat shock protein HslJ